MAGGRTTFLGEYQHALDEKGRLTVPARFRIGLGDPFITTRGLDGCLFAYPLDIWERISGQLESLPFTESAPRAFARLFFSGATEASFDRQGRFLIPPVLRSYAALDREAAIIGVSNRVEIWSGERWREYRAKAEQDYQTLAEGLFKT
jgi:MraZ protein